MAQIQDCKSGFYSQKQSVRDESLAPLYLESAGDLLIKDLAKKQLQTNITLEQQLEVTQNFEKGLEIQPNLLKGVKSLEQFKQEVGEEEEYDGECIESEKVINDLEELKKVTGLSRRELELSLSEKPNSTISKLYRFAVTSKKRPAEEEPLEARLLHHPINHLKEIEEEYFGHLKKAKKNTEKIDDPEEGNKETSRKSHRKKKKHRKRKNKGKSDHSESLVEKKAAASSTRDIAKEMEKKEKEGNSTKPRRGVSLWDVKDMRKWCEGKEYSCKPQTLYTIKEGKIVKIEELNRNIGGVT